MPDGDAPEWVLGGRYRILERLGAGGMAEVFRAHDETLDRDVAVKVFRTVVEDPDDPGGEERRELELHALARLNHPHLVTLYDGTVTQHPGFLVLELVEGPTLAQRLREGPLPEATAVALGAQVADALAYVHANGMVHRDVKPANILLGNDGGPGPDELRVRLSDFGIVRLVGSNRMTAIGRTMGTATYLAPEQARGLDVGAPADVYSLGLVLIEALTGVPSFDGPMEEVVAARLSRAPEVPANLPQPWPGLLTAMTATDPAARPDAATVASTLRGTSSFAALAALPTAAVPPVAGLAGVPGPFTGAVAGAATGPVAGSTASTGPSVAVPVLAPLPVGDTRRGAHRERRSGVGWLLGAAALAVIVAGGLIVLLSFNGGDSPGNSPASTTSNQPGHNPGGGSLAANTKSTHSAPPSNSASNPPSHSSAPSSAPPTSSSAAPSQPTSSQPTTRTSTRTSSSATTSSSSSRPPSSSTSVRHTSSAASSSTSPAAKSTSPVASSTTIRPAGR